MAHQEISGESYEAPTNLEDSRKKAETLRGLWIDRNVVPVPFDVASSVGEAALTPRSESETA